MLRPDTKALVEERIRRAKSEIETVKSKVASGNWRDAEPDPSRLRAYLARRRKGTVPRGAEAVQGPSDDFQRSAFLVEGAEVRRAIGLVEVNDPRSSTQGSGFLISPRLFITNHHVIRDMMAARAASVTFDRESDKFLRPLPISTYLFDPDAFFVTSPEQELDYTLLALGARVTGIVEPGELGYLPLAGGEDRHAIGMPLNIIQHPNGFPKMIAVRNNLLTYRGETTLLYDTDTEVGSSGAPVFNDEWDVVALHHYGTPFRALGDDSATPEQANEGIRVSAIVAHLKSQAARLGEPQRKLLAEALALGEVRDVDAGHLLRITPPRRLLVAESAALGTSSSTFDPSPSPNLENVMVSDLRGSVRITVPLEISVRIGTGEEPALAAATATLPAPRLAVRRTTAAAEARKLDREYGNRAGFDETFIPGVRVPLPEVGASLKSDVAPLRATEEKAKLGILLYEHFSVVLSRSKRIALLTATNVDGATYLKVDRDTGQVSGAEGETWYKDPRTSDAFYLGQDFYSSWSHYFDRGHLTRRTDPTWGDAATAERANADTFHFTNCSPQHFRFNQTARYWQGLERYVLENGVLSGDDQRMRICVLQGPIFDDAADYWCDDVQIPSAYWKVVIWKAPSGLKSVGLVADQSQLMNETRRFVGTPTDKPSVDVSQWRVAITTIEKRTNLSFGQAVRDADSIAQAAQPAVGAEAAPLRLKSLDDIKLSSTTGVFR